MKTPAKMINRDVLSFPGNGSRNQSKMSTQGTQKSLSENPHSSKCVAIWPDFDLAIRASTTKKNKDSWQFWLCFSKYSLDLSVGRGMGHRISSVCFHSENSVNRHTLMLEVVDWLPKIQKLRWNMASILARNLKAQKSVKRGWQPSRMMKKPVHTPNFCPFRTEILKVWCMSKLGNTAFIRKYGQPGGSTLWILVRLGTCTRSIGEHASPYQSSELKTTISLLFLLFQLVSCWSAVECLMPSCLELWIQVLTTALGHLRPGTA